MIEALAAAARIYLDANCIIYFVERSDERQAAITELIRSATQNGQTLACSEIGVAECLYGAFKLQDAALEATYHEIFYDIALLELCPVDGERSKAAARLGAEKALKLVDALHFAAAIEMQCDVFVTNDARFRSSYGIQVMQLDDLIA